MQAEAQFLQAKFLQGVYPFEGHGLDRPFRLTDELFYDSVAERGSPSSSSSTWYP